MIDARELRIGNWVQSRDRDGDGSLVQIKSIDNKGINYFVSNGGYEYEYLFEKTDKHDWFWVEPIFLSSEVLLACGFRKDSEYRFSRELPIGNGSDIEVSYDPVFDEWEITLENGKNEFFPESIKSLHQLQNIYFTLTGKELEYSPNK